MKLCLGCMEEIQDNVTICPYCGYKEDTPVDEAYYLSGGTLLAQRYIVGKVLGYGGFGITYIGWDVLLKRKVAIKEYFPSDFVTRGVESTKITIYSGDAYTQFQAGLTRFISEAKKLAQFNHTDGIVHIYDCIQENGTGYIIMEFLNGQTIKEILKFKNKYSYEEAEAVILHVLDALEEVHKTGIIHRDIAPDNLFITKDGEIKLIDFGAARYAASSKSKSLSVILKPGYAPEEQYRAHGEQGPWTDVYGVGATFYRMITGVRPEEAIERLIDGHIQSPSSLGIDIPPQKETALMKSLSVKKEGRFQTVAEFKEALLGTADENSSVTDIEKPIPRAYPPRKWLVLGGSAFLAVTVFAFLLGRNAPVQETSLPGNQDNKSVVESTPMLNIQDTSGSARIPTATPPETARTTEIFPTSDLMQIPEASPTPMPAISSAPEPTPTPEASPTPEPTPTPEVSPTPEPTPTPEASPTPEPTPTPEASPTPEPTPTPEASPTPEPTPIPEASPTPESTPIPEASPTPTPTPIPEVSPTPETTPTPEASPTPALTPIPEISPTPEPTPTPEASPTPAPPPIPKISSTPTPTNVPQLSPTPVPSKAPSANTYPLRISLGDREQTITITNKTGFKMKTLQISTADGPEDTEIWKNSDLKNPEISSASIEAGKYYNLQMSDSKSKNIVMYYNLDLSNIKSLSLFQKDNYAFAVYVTLDKKEKISREPYRVSVYKNPEIFYALTSLNIRELPDTESGKVIAKFALGDEIKVYGAAKGLIDGTESDWYLVRMESGYGYVSADPAYTTTDKAESDSKKAAIQDAAKQAAQQPVVQQYSGSSSQSSYDNYSGGGGSGNSGFSGGSDGGVVWDDSGVTWE